jgi:hypothetical protein
VVVPSWSITNNAGAEVSIGNDLISVEDKTCNSSSTIYAIGMYLTSTGCTGVSGSNGYVDHKRSAEYYVNCTKTDCCSMSGTLQASKSSACGVNDIITDRDDIASQSYVTDIDLSAKTPTIYVCGAVLTPGESYSFTFEDRSTGTVTKDLTVQVISGGSVSGSSGEISLVK